MKATLEFNLPEDELEYKMASKGSDYYWALHSFKDELRGIVKHGFIDNKEMNEAEYLIAEKIQDKFYEFLNEYYVDLN
jgi:hypothetical protein